MNRTVTVAAGSRKNIILKSENVIISSEGNEYPYVVQVNSPKIEGVAVVAEGAGSGKKIVK